MASSETGPLPFCEKCNLKAPKAAAKFCRKCGGPLQIKHESSPPRPKCIKCQTVLEPDQEFCDDCGTNQRSEIIPVAATDSHTMAGQSTRETESEESRAKGSSVDVDERLQTFNTANPAESSIVVTFHVLLPHKIWGWDPQKSSLKIFFKHKGISPTEFTCTREFKEGKDGYFSEMEGTVNVPLSLIENSAAVPYKYVVQEYQNLDVESGFEWLYCHSDSDKEVHRCLVIPKAAAHAQGHFNQFDTIVYPKLKSKIRSLMPAFVQDLTQGDIPNHRSIQRMCLMFYLETYQTMLSQCHFAHDFNIKDFCDNVIQIFKCLYQQRIFTSTAAILDCGELKQDFLQKWLFQIAENLSRIEIRTAEQNGFHLFAAAAVACCFQSFLSLELKIQDIEAEKISNLLNVLRLFPTCHSKLCKDYDLLEQMVPEDFRHVVANAVVALCKSAIQIKTVSPVSWLCAMPLVHFLRKQCSPYEPMVTNPEKMSFTDLNIPNLPSIEKGGNKKAHKFVESSLNELKPFFQLDPLLLPMFISICPIGEFNQLIEHIPLYMYTLSLYKRFIEDVECIGISEAEYIVIQLITIKSKLTSFWDHSEFKPETMLAATLHLLLKIKVKKYKNDALRHCYKICSIVVSLILHSASICSENDATFNAYEKVEEFRSKLRQYIKEWVDRVCEDAQIGTHSKANWDQNRAALELEVWESLCEVDSPSKLSSLWENIVTAIINDRILKVYVSKISDLLYLVGLQKNTHQIISDTVTRLVTERMETMDVQALTTAVSALNKSGETRGTEDYIFSVFNCLLLKRYPQKCSDVTLDDVLEWNLWPTFMKIYKRKRRDASSCSAEAPIDTLMLDRISELMKGLWHQLSSNTVTLATIKNLQQKESHVKSLFEACPEDLGLHVEDFEQRLHELNAYQTYLKGLHQFYSSFLNSIEGMEELKSDLDRDVSGHQLITLCYYSSDEKQYVYPYFQRMCALSQVLPEFGSLIRNRVFHHIWKCAIADAQNDNTKLTISAVCEIVWPKVVEKMGRLKSQLLDQTLELSSIDDYFADLTCESTIQGALQDIWKWHARFADLHDSPTCPQSSVSSILNYFFLKDCQQAVKALLIMQKELSQTGDFSVYVELEVKVHSQLCMKTIQCMTNADEGTKSFAKHFCGSRLEYLMKFVKNLDVIKWLKKETKDVADLQAFVNLSLASSVGEEDLNNDRLSSLSIVGTGYQSLIYENPKDLQFEGLAQYYSVLWEAPNKNLKLPRLLEDCNKSVEWYKCVKESQGHDELTCYGQLRTIQQNGFYVIKFHSKTKSSNIIKLYTEPRKFMTLEELLDLESKLILIQRKEESKEGLEQFFDTLHTVRYIAELLLALHQVGSMQCAKWRVIFPCKINVLDELKKIAKDMEKSLNDWKAEVEKCRIEYYNLNYYTTQQLHTLRKELGKIRYGTVNVLSPQVQTLLQSISSNVNYEVVMTAVHKFLSKKQQMKAETALQITQMESTYDGKVQLGKEESQLTPKQKEIYMELTTQLGYNATLALIATKNCTEIYDATNYCEDNKSKLEQTELQLPHANHTTEECGIGGKDPIDPSASEFSGSSTSDEESHCPLDQLIASGYTHQQALKAIELHGNNMEEILHYLLNEESITKSLAHENDETDDEFEFVSCDELKINNSHNEEVLTIAELGAILENIPCQNIIKRTFPDKKLKFGIPVLLTAKPENILKLVLSIYMEDSHKPLPTFEEVLLCNENTTEEEVTLLLKRAIADPGFGRIFCLVHAEKLPFKVCDEVLTSLDRHTQGKQGYRLIIICCEGSHEMSHLVSKLHLYHQQYMFKNHYAEYILQHFKQSSCSQLSASDIDIDKSCVRVITSERPGMGKTLYIKRLAQKLSSYLNQNEPYLTIIPIHGPDVLVDKVVQSLCNVSATPGIIHFDIAPKVTWKVDTLLFSVLIMKGLCDSQGDMWRCHNNQLVVVEITLPSLEIQPAELCTHTFLKLLPCMHILSPNEVLTCLQTEEHDRSFKCHLMDEKKYLSPGFQMVYRYLIECAQRSDLDVLKFDVQNLEKDKLKWLKTIIRHCGVQDPSWSELRNFVRFLKIQLLSCENSTYCKAMELKGFKSFAAKFMILMSRDFATPSLDTATHETRKNALDQYQIRKRWEQQSHPYLFFNQDETSITCIGFNINGNGDLINSINHELIEKAIISKQLLEAMKRNFVDFQEPFGTMGKHQLLEKIGTIMGLQWLWDPDESYVLTADNVIKIIAIFMRFRCGIPVILIGDTGCGKTRLIQYMCDLMLCGNDSFGENSKNLFILKMHGGTTEDDIINIVDQAQLQAKSNMEIKLDTVLFFDEANTTEAMGLIKEIVCDGRINGKHIEAGIKIIAACNPYKKHSEQMIKKLEQAGLGYYVKSTETQDRLGSIPLRQLVYRVLDLPPSMKAFIYDFGTINPKNETDYIRRIVTHHQGCNGLPQTTRAVISEILECSQQFMKKQEDECSFVSLRDIERTMNVFEFFRDYVQKAEITLVKEKVDNVTSALILALSVCYHAKLKDRAAFEGEVIRCFKHPLSVLHSKTDFRNVIQSYQAALLDAMVIGPNTFIAKNEALRENVFMMAVCIELRIPLFLIGKPGSSKSLAKSIVASSMQGKASKHPLLQCFKQVHMFSYQCSQLSTTQSIDEVFKTAQYFQKNQNTAAFVSVVVLDEIGLAEDSPQFPLKALLPLLEDGTGAVNKSCVEERVAFVGISNWALDPAKMNRGIMVTRGDPSTSELKFSAEGICSNRDNDPIREKLKEFFEPLAKAYEKLVQTGKKRDFFGLRDFYSLIKMLYWNCSKSKDQELTWPMLLHSIKRNFGGLEGCDPVGIFTDTLSWYFSHYPLVNEKLIRDIHRKQSSILDPSELDLIESSLKNQDISWHGENRYLLFITENYAALQIVQNHLQNVIVLSHGNGSENESTKAFVIFGSSFPKDKKYTQVCRNINQIKICMETGRAVILLNLEHLYESLYDVLNQHYIYHGENRYVELGLQTHRVKCRVHKKFKLILIAEKSTVYERFPTPLINRLEKHFVQISTVLKPWQHEVVGRLCEWIEKFSFVRSESYTFNKQDAFIGYQNETPAAVVFQATEQAKKLKVANMERKELNYFNLNPLFQSHAGSSNQEESWGDMVLHQSKWLLLQIASPSALIRLRKSHLKKEECMDLSEIYFKKQFHFSLLGLLEHLLSLNSGIEILQVTTHSHLLTISEQKKLSQRMKLEVFCYNLHEFDTEIDFCSKVSTVFTRQGRSKAALLIIQCESGHLYGDLIACARYKICDEIERYRTSFKRDEESPTHVLFIINLPYILNSQCTFVGFQGDYWTSLHLDKLWPDDQSDFDIHTISELKLSDVFIGTQNISPQYQRLHCCIHAAVSQISNSSRAIECVSLLLDLIPKATVHQPSGGDSFYSIVIDHIHRILLERELSLASDWILDEAINVQRLQYGGTFHNALIRKIDEVITPILAQIVYWCDYKCNLNLIHADDPPSNSVRRFWLLVFKNKRIMSISYNDCCIKSRNYPVLDENYKCIMPFSWIIKESVDTAWSHAISEGGNDMDNLYMKTYSWLKDAPIGEVLEAVSENDCEKLFQSYLHDFVRSIHRSHHTDLSFYDKEYQHISDALNRLCDSQKFNAFGSLTKKIAALKTVHWFYQTHITWFGQLSWSLPGILEHIYELNSVEMTLHLQGAKAALVVLNPPLNHSESAMQQWVQRMQYSQNAIYSALSLSTTTTEAKLLETRVLWQYRLAIKLFIEHIVLHYKDTTKYLKRIHTILKHSNQMDFSKGKTVENVMKMLNTMTSEQTKQSGILNSSNEFFFELVSTLCFNYWSMPDEKLAEILIQRVFDVRATSETEQDVQKIISNVPVTKILLLHLLLENRSHHIRGQLHNYFRKIQLSLNKHSQLCLLFMHCMEDTLRKEWSSYVPEAGATQLLSEAFQYISQNASDNDKIKEHVERMADIRFVLEKVADILHKSISSSAFKASSLLEKAHDICTTVNSPAATDCALYLMKVIIRQFGISSLNMIAAIHPWVVPAYLMDKKKGETDMVDPFVIYNSEYFNVYENVTKVLHSEQATNFNLIMENHAVMCILAVYSVLFYQESGTNLPSEGISKVECALKLLQLPQQLQAVVQIIIANQKCGLLPPFSVNRPQPNILATLNSIVVHAVSVISVTNPLSIVAPLFNLLTNPSLLKDKYLPAMPDDTTLSYQAVSGLFYSCSKGHPYLVTECGNQPVACPTCGVLIAGPIQSSTSARSNLTKTGYILGHGRATATPERNLTPASCSIIQALIHSLLLWTICNDKVASPSLVQLLPPIVVQESQIPEFLLRHLENDVLCLGKAIGKSYDEALVVIHLVLQNILKHKLSYVTDTGALTFLSTKDSRANWELQFQTTYIHPALQEMNTKIHSIMQLNGKNEKLGSTNRLLEIAYESQEAEERFEKCLWAFRPKVTLDNLLQLTESMDFNTVCPVLHAFLIQETKLCAIQYLPDIVQLQQYFHDRYASQIQYKKLAGKTIGHFLRDSGDDCGKLRKMISSLSKAWQLVHGKLPDHASGRLQLNTKYLVPDITEDSTLQCLIPMTTGYGACTTLLVDFLVCTHNDFLHKSLFRNSAVGSRWKPQKIPISHLNACHLINYEHELLPIIVSHCQYSKFTESAGQQIEVHLGALEKRIVDQFIRGKPYIIFDVPLVVLKKELTSALRKKIIQVQLSEQDRAKLCDPLNTPNSLKDALEDISILMGFLSSMGGNGETSITDHATKTLRMRAPKVPQFLKLKHIVSVWQALSVQLAITTQQEPFEQFDKEILGDLEQPQKDELDKVLRCFNLDNLLGILYELVESQLRFCSQEELSQSLVQTVKVFLDTCDISAIPQFDEFPSSITFKQIVATWKHIATYQQNHKHDK